MKRSIALILLFSMLLTVFSACSGEEVTLLNFLMEGSSTLDLDDEVVTICSEEGTDDVLETLFEQPVNTAPYDAILKRLSMLEDKYNCSFDIVSRGYEGNMTANLMTLASTGDSTIDIIFAGSVGILSGLALGGIILPLTDVKDYIDYENSEKFGSAGLLEVAMVNGVPHAVQPVQWPGFTNNYAFYITYNRDQFNRYAMTDLHEYYENETWTFDTFENLFKTYETVPSEEVDLFYLQKGFFTYSSMLANGVKLCDYNGKEFYTDFDSTKTYNAIEWAFNICDRYEDSLSIADYPYCYEEFNEEKVIMALTNTMLITQNINYKANFEFGIMPFPCGPDAVYGEWACFTETIRGFAISAFSDIPEASAMIINDLFDPFEEISTENGLAEYYRDQVFLTDLDTEIFLETGKNIRSLYGSHNPALINFMADLKNTTTKSVAQFIQEHEGPIEALITEHIRPNYENYLYEHLEAESLQNN